MSTTKNVQWVAKSDRKVTVPTIAGEQVLIGTSNESPRDAQHEGDRGTYCMCF